jgi:hypothetical protein
MKQKPIDNTPTDRPTDCQPNSSLSVVMPNTTNKIQALLPILASELNSTVEQLGVYLNSILPSPYSESFHQIDLTVKDLSTPCNPIFIARRRRHDPNNPEDIFFGCRIFQTRGETPIRFAAYRTMTDQSLFIILPKDQLQALYRYANRQPIKVAEIKKPILPAETMSSVWDETIGFLELLRKHREIEIRASRGLLLHGPPGNGKTMICRWLLQEATQRNWSSKIVTASEIESAFGQNQLTQLFGGSAVIVCDDIDIAFFSRSGHKSEIACSLLSALDGATTKQPHTVRIFTTNETVSDLDPAFQRPGRIDRAIRIPLPDDQGRLAFAKTWHKKLLEQIPASEIASACSHLSFAEMDEVQRNLLINWVKGSKEWNLKQAITDLENRLSDMPPKSAAGFGFGLQDDADED